MAGTYVTRRSPMLHFRQLRLTSSRYTMALQCCRTRPNEDSSLDHQSNPSKEGSNIKGGYY